MTRLEMMKLGEELASNSEKAAVGKINQLYSSATSQYGQTEEAINHFLKLLYLFETQGDSLCGGTKMFNDMRKIIRNEFILEKTDDHMFALKSRYNDLSAGEWSLILGYALRYAEIRSKLKRKDDGNISEFDISEKSKKKFNYDGMNDKRKFRHHTNLRHKGSTDPKFNYGAKQEQSINTSLSEQLLKWKNSQDV